MSLSISSMGLVSSLGTDPDTAAAAFRAGLVRPRELDFPVLDEDANAQPVTGYPACGDYSSFFQFGLWIQLAGAALRGLVQRGGLPGSEDRGYWDNILVVSSLPIWEEERFGYLLDKGPEPLKEFYLERALAAASLQVKRERLRFVGYGSCGPVQALSKSLQLLRMDPQARVLLLEVDSYVDPDSLAWLAERNRLKSPEIPFGLIPGQAGACLLLEAPAVLAARKGRPEAFLENAAWRAATPDPENNPREIAESLASVIREVLQTTSKGRPFSGDIFLDLNGENWKAKAWAYAQILLQQELDFAAMKTILPAEGFGETGIAFAPLAIILAARAFARGYAGKGPVLIVCLSDNGETGAILVMAPEAGPGSFHG
ncbi:MAG TPA: hypothetical protein VK465_18590 [Fibrobacteria bacterium]|nr:hypothetical protein [Fibrobacteria bacterium]